MDPELGDEKRLITPSMLEELPDPAKRCLVCTGTIGHRWIDSVRLNSTAS
jgi:hypothetical protein